MMGRGRGGESGRGRGGGRSRGGRGRLVAWCRGLVRRRDFGGPGGAGVVEGNVRGRGRAAGSGRVRDLRSGGSSTRGSGRERDFRGRDRAAWSGRRKGNVLRRTTGSSGG
jgi:hypothetical protein